MYEDFEDYEFEDIELYEHKRSDKVKWIISFLDKDKNAGQREQQYL